MRTVQPYRTLNKFIQAEAFEPMLSWGLRMSVAAMLPIVWGVWTNNIANAIWVSLTAESICWVELKGSFSQKFRILIFGGILALLFAVLGSLTANVLWLTLIAMLFTGFLAGMFKNLGDRGSGLSICVFVMFLITNAFPPADDTDMWHRLQLVFIGGFWNMLVGIGAFFFTPAQEPYRRTVALIWRSIEGLSGEVAKGWDGTTLRSGIRDIYLQEKEVRSAIDTSLQLFEKMEHQVSEQDVQEKAYARFRKASALVATHIISISEELEAIPLNLDPNLRLKLFTLMRAMQQTAERMSMYILSLKTEEQLLLTSRINRLYKLTNLLRETAEDTPYKEQLQRVAHLADRAAKLTESAIQQLRETGKDQPVYRSYSLYKTMFILHPKYWWRNLRLLFNFNNYTLRFALRSAIATTLAMAVFKIFEIDHGYWVPLTVFIVLQPHFGATWKKAIDRVIGTITGGIAGGIILRLPIGLYGRELILFATFLLMMYYIRKRYAVAAFFITINLVILLNFEAEVAPELIFVRALSTMGGAVLAVVAGYALLPQWDKKNLPIHLSNAVCSNYQFFKATFLSAEKTNWIKHKRSTESANSAAFDSFTRYVNEPVIGKKYIPTYFQLITHNIRITRELNNIHLEEENFPSKINATDPQLQRERIEECLQWFNTNLQIFLNNGWAEEDVVGITSKTEEGAGFPLSNQQFTYLSKMLIELKSMHQDLQKLEGKKEFVA